MISINNLSIHFNGIYLFENVSFVIGDNDKIGLVGKNGAGKTTLLNILSQELQPQTGNIVYSSGCTIGYLPQEIKSIDNKTVWDSVMAAFSEVKQIEEEITNLLTQIADETDVESEAYSKKINRLEDLNHRLSYMGYENITSESEKVLLGLGFKRSDFNRMLSEFSSGWQMRVELAKILLRRTDVLLLDEPTNHLDIESIQWLERFLQSYSGAIVMVSHDRTFLDCICKRTIEITMGGIEDYNCNYTQYVERRAERVQYQKQVQDNQKKEIAEIERFIERFRYKATKAKQVQSRVKLLEKMDLVQVDDIDTSKIHFLFPPAPKCERVVFEAQNLSLSYGNHLVLDKLNFVIQKGEKIAFVGRNGEGKTTLMRLFNKELFPTNGILECGNMVKIGYFAQNHNTLLDFNKTVFETIDDVAVGEIRTKVRAILGSFLFSNDDIEKKVAVLSGGEKSRLVLAKLLLEPYNVLILDEPTNHLDMKSKDVLKNALLHYDGTLILVSHDRDFLQGLTNKVLEVKSGKIKEYLGDIQYYLDKQAESLQQFQNKKLSDSTDDNISQSISEQKKNWQEQKQKDSLARKINKQIEELERQITQYEQELELISLQLSDTEKYKKEIASGELYQQYDKVQKKLEATMQEWENLVEKANL